VPPVTSATRPLSSVVCVVLGSGLVWVMAMGRIS
jgi:hypothetical protein